MRPTSDCRASTIFFRAAPGNMAIQGKDRYGCSNRKRTGTCDNATTITRQNVEGRVLASLKSKLLAPENLQAFVSQVSKALSADQQTAGGNQRALEKAIASKDVKISRILDQIEEGAGQAGLLLPRLEQRNDLPPRFQTIQKEGLFS